MIKICHNREYLLQENPGNVAEKGKDRVLEVDLTLSNGKTPSKTTLLKQVMPVPKKSVYCVEGYGGY